MLASFLITFRELFEIALLVILVVGYLVKTGQVQLRRYVWWGAGAGALLSAAGAAIIRLTSANLAGRAEEIFEAAIMLVSAALISTLLGWALRQERSMLGLQQRAIAAADRSHRAGIIATITFGVLREGMELVLLLTASEYAVGGNLFAGFTFGAAAAGVGALVLYQGGRRLPLRQFFVVTNVLLALFAFMLAVGSIGKLIELS